MRSDNTDRILVFKFWWHVIWPDFIVHRTKLFLTNNASRKFISINLLEYTAIIINFAASIVSFQDPNTQTPFSPYPYPVLLNWADNRASIKWTNVMCTKNQAGRSLGRIFSTFLLNNPLGINCDYIPTGENIIADEISRLKKTNNNLYDYASLLQDFPQLQDCKIFQPSKELLSMLEQSLLNGISPPLHVVQHMKHSNLGQLISYPG